MEAEWGRGGRGKGRGIGLYRSLILLFPTLRPDLMDCSIEMWAVTMFVGA